MQRFPWEHDTDTMNKYWRETSKQTERAIALCCTGSTIVSILSESHLDLSATETFFWTCLFPLWCNSCGDTRIVYKCCLYCSNVVAKDSGFATQKNKKNDTDTRMASAVLYTMWNTFWLKSKNISSISGLIFLALLIFTSVQY